MNEKITKGLDNFGALASWACAVHCLVLPFLVGVLPLIGLSFLLSETTEKFLIGVSVILAVFSLLPSYYMHHGKLRSIFLALAGLSLIIVTHLLFEDSFLLKAILLITGAVLITAAHMLNRYLCHTCRVC